MGFFADTIYKFTPSWFQNPYMGTMTRAVAAAYDAMAGRVFDGRRASNPYAAGARGADGALFECPADVLPYHSRDRGIRLYSTEPEPSQRFRLGQWRQLKKRRGSHQGELRNVQPYFLSSVAMPRMRIVHQSNGSPNVATWHTLDAAGVYSVHRASPSNWNWDDAPALRSRFWLIVYTNELGLEQSTWDGPTRWDDGALWGGLFTKAQIDDLVAMINEAKAAHSILWGVILATDPDSFRPQDPVIVDPDGWSNLPNGKWGFVIDNDTGQPTRLPSAIVAFDLGQG